MQIQTDVKEIFSSLSFYINWLEATDHQKICHRLIQKDEAFIQNLEKKLCSKCAPKKFIYEITAL